MPRRAHPRRSPRTSRHERARAALWRDRAAQLREARGWSQEQLAERAGLNRSYIGEIERGTSIASIVTVDKLARALDVSMERLLTFATQRHGAADRRLGAEDREVTPIAC